MINKVSRVSHQHAREFDEAVAEIVRDLDPARVICFGVRNTINEAWSCLKSLSSNSTCSFDLLIVLKEGRRSKDHEVIDKIKNTVADRDIHINSIVHNASGIVDVLSSSYFFTEVLRKGLVIYSDNTTSIESLNDSKTDFDNIEDLQRCWDRWSNLGDRFYETAGECIGHQRNDIAAFLLHQAVEATCIAIVRSCLGYRPTTHNLRRLFSLVENISPDIIRLFPGNTEQESELLTILVGAYSDVRYKEKYKVSGHDTLVLAERVRELQFLGQELFQERIDQVTMQKNQAGSQGEENRKIVREYHRFSSISIDTFASVILVQGKNHTVQVECTKDQEAIIRVWEENDRLWIATEGMIPMHQPTPIIYITCTQLEGIVVNGAANVSVANQLEGNRLGVIQNSHGPISLNVNTILLDATVTKSGGLKIAGDTSELWIRNHGSGEFEGNNLECDSAKVTILGSGSVSITVSEELFAKVNGSGDLFYKGAPRLKSIDNTGEGRLKQL